MQAPIGYVKISPLQAELDGLYGAGVFTVGVAGNGDHKNFWLEYGPGVPQQSVDGALAAASTNEATYLGVIKVELYERLAEKAAKIVAARPVPSYTAAEIQSAVDWLADQSQPLPACVQFVALAEGLSNVDAATVVANSMINYNTWVDTVNQIKVARQTAVMASTDVYTAKGNASSAMDQMKSA